MIEDVKQPSMGLGKRLTESTGGIPNVGIARIIAEYVISLTGGTGSTAPLLTALQNLTREGVSTTLVQSEENKQPEKM